MESQGTCNARLAWLWRNGKIPAGHRMIYWCTTEQIGGEVGGYIDIIVLYPARLVHMWDSLVRALHWSIDTRELYLDTTQSLFLIWINVNIYIYIDEKFQHTAPGIDFYITMFTP